MASKMVSTSVAGPENFMEPCAEKRLRVRATLTMAVDGPTEGGVDILEKGLANVPCVCLKMPLY